MSNRDNAPTSMDRALLDDETLVGVSNWVRGMRTEILRVAPSRSSVLISGPTGTGKELIARAVHRHSPRCARPFVVVDCAAVSGALFASHMFGHVKGAFTGAESSFLGCFRAGNGGSIFLDEIGELEPEFQSKLLRVLQEHKVTPLGSHEEVPVNIRVIAATNRDLRRQVAAKRFREDLYYRLNVIELQTMPLKDRPEDIEHLAQDFLARLAKQEEHVPNRISPRCLKCLRLHDWPGNVRELENYLERAAFLHSDQDICLEAFPRISERALPIVCGAAESAAAPSTTVGSRAAAETSRRDNAIDPSTACPTLAEVERVHIQRALELADHNLAVASNLLAIPRQQLLRKIAKHGLDASRSRPGRPSK